MMACLVGGRDMKPGEACGTTLCEVNLGEQQSENCEMSLHLR